MRNLTLHVKFTFTSLDISVAGIIIPRIHTLAWLALSRGMCTLMLNHHITMYEGVEVNMHVSFNLEIWR